MSITTTVQERYLAADSTISPTIITDIMALIQALLGGCTGAQVKARRARRPVLTQLYVQAGADVKWWNDPATAAQVSNASMIVLDASSAAEIDEFKAAQLPPA